MKKKFIFPGRDDDGSSFRLLSVILVAAIFAKGMVLFRGFSFDDFSFSGGMGEKDFDLFFSQGRYLMAFLFWIIESLGVNSGDLFFPLGIAVLILQSAFVVSVFRFVGVEKLPAAGLVGAMVVAHPYLAEVLSFRLILPSYCVALIFSIVALEAVISCPSAWSGRAISLVAALGMVFTYQVFLNYFAVAIGFSLLLALIARRAGGQSSAITAGGPERALDLTLVSVAAGAIFLLVTALARYLGLNGDVDRARLIGASDFPERMRQIYSSLVNIYWAAEPVYSGWLKILVAAILGYSFLIILWRLVLSGKQVGGRRDSAIALLVLVLLVPASLGLIIAFRSWWPVPRVIAHVSVLLGLILLTADVCSQGFNLKGLRFVGAISRFTVLVGFVFLSNQILVDQQRLNDWDRLMANRIISRLEMNPNFVDVRFVSINGGSWAFPRRLRTIQGDLNVSAFYPENSKVSLLSEISGYKLENADAAGAAKGADYCRERQPWPDAESVAVVGNLAIICLRSIS